MAAKIRPDDWNRAFDPKAAPRGGPLRALMISLVLILLCIGLGIGASFGQAALSQRQAQQATAAALALNAPTSAATAEPAPTATAEVQAPTEAVPAAPAEEVELGRAPVITAGNFRSAPELGDATVAGQVCIGDELAVLEELPGDGILWLRVRVTAVASDCAANRVSIGSRGWISAVLVGR